jgi:N-dimethylarginine dimethylaminohydrolase
LPHGWRDLRRKSAGDAALSYRNFRTSLETLGIREMIEMLAAESMITLRAQPGYLHFMAKYHALAHD